MLLDHHNYENEAAAIQGNKKTMVDRVGTLALIPGTHKGCQENKHLPIEDGNEA